MSLEVKIFQHIEYVEVIVSGEYDMQEAIDKFPTVLSACKISGLSKVLVDFRKIHGDIYAVQKIIYTEQVLNQVQDYFESGGKELQFAFVGKAPQVSTYEPGLEIVDREGMQAIVTYDIHEAFNWLDIRKS